MGSDLARVAAALERIANALEAWPATHASAAARGQPRPADVDGQGDPEELITKRSDTFIGRKLYKCSTPTVVGGRIDVAYQQSDQRKFYVPCPHCGHEQVLVFERLRWETRKRWEFTRADDGQIIEVAAANGPRNYRLAR